MPQRDETNPLLVCLETCNTHSLQEQTKPVMGSPSSLLVDCRPLKAQHYDLQRLRCHLTLVRDLLAQGWARCGTI